MEGSRKAKPAKPTMELDMEPTQENYTILSEEDLRLRKELRKVQKETPSDLKGKQKQLLQINLL